MESNLSIQRLAEMAGVSPAGISKVERNAMSPTVTFLMKVAVALNKRVAAFLDEEIAVPEVAFVARGKRRRIGPIGTRLAGERLSGRLDGSKLDVGILDLSPGYGSGRDLMNHGGEELHLCLEGRVEFAVGGGVYVLNEGDSIHFKSGLPHSWKNSGRRRARMLYVTMGGAAG